MFNFFDFMPVQGSSWAARVDWINNFITWIMLVSLIAITAAMVYFAIKYRERSPNQPTLYFTHSRPLETVWTVIPTLIVMYVFYYGLTSYKEMREAPPNALEVNVDAYSWRWEFTYPNGKRSTGELVVPLGQPVRLIMTSHDVIHNFFVPAMRVKEDVYANNYSFLWFTPTVLGTFPAFCAEYCGLNHWNMRAFVKVVSPEQFTDFLLDRATVEVPLPDLGKQLFAAKGCAGCHSLDGTVVLGPSVKGLFASGTRAFEDGTSAPVDENYVRESILNPQARIVKGFAGRVMPSFQGQLNERELAGLIAHLKTL